MKKIKITCTGANNISIDKLENFQGNLKKLSNVNLKKIKKQILLNGFNVPFFIWKDSGKNKILDGHQRLKGLKSLQKDGYEIPLLPVAYIEADNEKDARQKLLGITSQYGEFEIDELENWLSEIDKDIVESLRFSDEEMIFDEKEIEEKTEIEEKAEAEFLGVGDLLELNGHRVLCGDSFESKNINKLINNKKIDMIFTDPPYDLSKTEWFKNAIETCNKNIFVMHSDKNQVLLISEYFKYFKKFFVLTFKVPIMLNSNQPMNGHTLISHFCKTKQNFINTKDGFSTHLSGYKKLQQLQSKDHKHKKETDFIEKFIIHYSKENDIILDFFAGAGSILISSEKINRKCYCIELDPANCEIIFYRYRNICLDNNIKMDFKLNGKKINNKMLNSRKGDLK